MESASPTPACDGQLCPTTDIMRQILLSFVCVWTGPYLTLLSWPIESSGGVNVACYPNGAITRTRIHLSLDLAASLMFPNKFADYVEYSTHYRAQSREKTSLEQEQGDITRLYSTLDFVRKYDSTRKTNSTRKPQIVDLVISSDDTS